MRKVEEVIIVGGGPAGLAVSACLKQHSIPSMILEREDCSISLWRNRAYDRLKLHLAKEFCELPHMHFPDTAPTFLSKDQFIHYIDRYVTRFELQPLYGRWVQSAAYNGGLGAWCVAAKNTETGELEECCCKFLVVTIGENGSPNVPEIDGLESFKGGDHGVVHSVKYRSGKPYEGQDVLVVGCGNSGMEIALDLCNHRANTSIVIRNELHVVTREIMYTGMKLLKRLPMGVVDALTVLLSKFNFGDLAKHGILRPEEGPFLMKQKYGRAAVIDVGTIDKIKSGEIKVCPGIKLIRDNEVEFEDGQVREFDAIVLATGYTSAVGTWFQDDDGFFGKDGVPAAAFPNHWKGKNGLYCAGFARRGLLGIAEDARNIADDIRKLLHQVHVGISDKNDLKGNKIIVTGRNILLA